MDGVGLPGKEKQLLPGIMSQLFFHHPVLDIRGKGKTQSPSTYPNKGVLGYLEPAVPFPEIVK
jgi:hypothetical protein